MTVIEKNAWGMVENAKADIISVSVDELLGEMNDDVIIVDIRDIREVWIEGSIPDVKHAPRGMIEFWADSETKYYKEFFSPEKQYLLYCNEGGRSALAVKRLQEMGYEDVAHLQGGFTAWKECGGEVVDIPQKDYKNR
jgi:rhodanese-related sulfurtransferase